MQLLRNNEWGIVHFEIQAYAEHFLIWRYSGNWRGKEKGGNVTLSTVLLHNRERECPSLIYLALKIRGETRRHSLVDAFFNIGFCMSYDRLLTISTDIATNVCSHFEKALPNCEIRFL